MTNHEAILAVILHMLEQLGFLDVHSSASRRFVHTPILLLYLLLMLLIEVKKDMPTVMVLIKMEMRRKGRTS